MVFKKVIFFVLFVFVLEVSSYAQEATGPKKAGSKLDDVTTKLEQLQKGQEEIMKELKNLKEELYVIKIRVTHR